MSLKKAVKIATYVYSDLDSELSKLGISAEKPIFENEIKPVYFFDISSVCEHEEDGRTYTLVVSDGFEYLSPENLFDVIEKIEKAL